MFNPSATLFFKRTMEIHLLPVSGEVQLPTRVAVRCTTPGLKF